MRLQERVCAKPVKFVARNGMHLRIGYDLEAKHLTMKHQGIDLEKLPPVKHSLQIC